MKKQQLPSARGVPVIIFPASLLIHISTHENNASKCEAEL